MTRKIKASEVREGMEIRWEEDGAVIRLSVFEVMAADCGRVSFVPESRTPWHVKRDQVVTVLSEPQPDEPTAFGAAVEAGGIWFVRLDDRDLSDPDFQPWQSESLIQFTWAEVCDHGPVTVVNADPFANTEPREPRVWDRWEDVPELTPVCLSGTKTPYRKVGGRIESKVRGSWGVAFTDEYTLSKYSPFTEALDA